MEEFPTDEEKKEDEPEMELEPRSPEEVEEWIEAAREQLPLAEAEVENLSKMLEGDLGDEERAEVVNLLTEAQELVEGLKAMLEEEGDLNKVL